MKETREAFVARKRLALAELAEKAHSINQQLANDPEFVPVTLVSQMAQVIAQIHQVRSAICIDT